MTEMGQQAPAQAQSGMYDTGSTGYGQPAAPQQYAVSGGQQYGGYQQQVNPGEATSYYSELIHIANSPYVLIVMYGTLHT